LIVTTGILVVVGSLAVGCAQPGVPQGAASASPSSWIPPIEGIAVDWDKPIGGTAISLADLAAIEAKLPFTVLLPRGLGTPAGIFLSDTTSVAFEDQVVAFVYESTPYGQVDVEESLPTEPTDEWKADAQRIVGQNGQPYTHGSTALISVRGGSGNGLTTTSEDGTISDLRWLENDALEVLVRGPKLNVQDCIEISAAL
jgi:hypothetical protein